jgi:hypothetical protein
VLLLLVPFLYTPWIHVPSVLVIFTVVSYSWCSSGVCIHVPSVVVGSCYSCSGFLVFDFYFFHGLFFLVFLWGLDFGLLF